MGRELEKVIEELKARRDNIDTAIRIIQSELKPRAVKKGPGRPRKKTQPPKAA